MIRPPISPSFAWNQRDPFYCSWRPNPDDPTVACVAIAGHVNDHKLHYQYPRWFSTGRIIISSLVLLAIIAAVVFL